MNITMMEYQETLTSIRHYGNMRFALLTLFTTATAGLFFLIYTDTGVREHPSLATLMKISGVALSIAFMYLENHLSRYMITLGQQLIINPYSHMTKLHDYDKRTVRNIFLGIYAGIIIVWFLTLIMHPECGQNP